MFKKRKINNSLSNKKNNVVVKVIWILSILFVFIIAFNTLEFLNENNFFINNSDWNTWIENETKVKKSIIWVFSNILNTWTNNLTKESNKELQKTTKTNILLLGRWGIWNDAPNLTDSIILVSINSKFEVITMLSIPRDFYVEDKNWKWWKINQVYALNRHKWEEYWLWLLKKHVEDITWEKINYYINIDFNWFINFIDAIWWIDINVPKTLVDNKYPDWNWEYRTMIIKKWNWLFDWDTSLKYARSRHSTSDFDRSLRQQQIISSIKDKLNEGGVFSKLKNATKFYDIFTKYIDTDIEIADLKELFDSHVNLSTYDVLSFNFNDSCFYWDPSCKRGWFLYVPDRKLFWWSSVLLPNWAYLGNISDYSILHKFTDLIFNKSYIYKENLKINIFNSTKSIWIAWDLATIFKRYGFWISDNNSIGNIKDKKFLKSIVYYNSYIKDSETLKYLKTILNIEFVEKKHSVYWLDNWTMIEIVLWEDYEKVMSNLKNNL